MVRTAILTLFLCILGGVVIPGGSAAPEEAQTPIFDDGVLSIRRDTLTAPRPLTIITLTLDLASPRYELDVAVTEDPDGDGPAQATLTMPEILAHRAGARVFINANAFAAIGEKPSRLWYPGRQVTVLGLSRSRQATQSLPDHGYTAFWLDRDGTPRLGQPDRLDTVLMGIAGFGWLVRDDKAVPREDAVLQPRTALGLDAEGRTLILVTVDGRQSGVSEGMSATELAALMRERKATNAIMLDGGGSTVMLFGDGRRHALLNRPCERLFGLLSAVRPLPNGLVIRTAPAVTERERP